MGRSNILITGDICETNYFPPPFGALNTFRKAVQDSHGRNEHRLSAMYLFVGGRFYAYAVALVGAQLVDLCTLMHVNLCTTSSIQTSRPGSSIDGTLAVRMYACLETPTGLRIHALNTSGEPPAWTSIERQYCPGGTVCPERQDVHVYDLVTSCRARSVIKYFWLQSAISIGIKDRHFVSSKIDHVRAARFPMSHEDSILPMAFRPTASCEAEAVCHVMPIADLSYR